MKKVDISKGDGELKNLRAHEVPEVLDLPFSLLSKRDNKTTKLVANSGESSPIKGKNRWFDYEFSEPVFLCEIIVEIQDYESWNKFEFKWLLAGGGEASVELLRQEDDTYHAKIYQLVSSVSFKPPKKWLSDPKIDRVCLIGFTRDEVEDFTKATSRLDSYKSNIIRESEKALEAARIANAKIESLEEDESALDLLISEKKKNEDEINSNIGRLTEERKALVEDIVIRKNNIKELESQSSLIDERIAERQSERNSLAKEISEKGQELASLEADINMFPTELSGFTAQGAHNTLTYWKLAFVPLALLIIVTSLLIFNAANLTTVLDENDNARIWSILITRIPYVLISAAIIAVSFRLAKICISEIIKINQQRLNLSKINIIATDVSNSSEEGLEGLSDEEIYQLRTKLKMHLLRDHLKEYLSKEPLSEKSVSLRTLAEKVKKSPSTTRTEETVEEKP